MRQNPIFDIQSPHSTDRLLSVKEVCTITGTCRSWVHEKTTAQQFPQPIRLGPRYTRWRASEVSAWVADPTGWAQAQHAPTGAPQ